MEQSNVFTLLAATGPYTNYYEQLMLYGQFIGSWNIESTWHEKDGGIRKGKGEWYFNWILGGRGIQDVLFAAGASAHQFGTTLRCYDPALDVWHVTWMQPYGGEFVHLIGRKVGNRIVQEGTGSDPRRRERWSFTDITPDSFSWLGEVSFDDGKTWLLEQEMRATRHEEKVDDRKS